MNNIVQPNSRTPTPGPSSAVVFDCAGWTELFVVRLLTLQAVEIPIAAQIDRVVHKRWRRVEPVVQPVRREHLVALAVAKHKHDAIPPRDVDAAARPHGRGEDLRQPLEAL